MDINELKEQLLESNSITIVTHKNPDGDAIGSSLGLQNFLKNINITSTVVIPNSAPKFLHWMEGYQDILNHEENPQEAEKKIAESELIFCLDFNALHRIGDIGILVDKSKSVKVLIDHHIDPGNFAQFVLSDTKASSASELVYEFICLLKETKHINQAAGEALYCGIITDTGSFKFPSTSARTHEIASTLISNGVDNGKVHQLVYDSSSITRIQLIGHCLNSMEVINNQASLFTLTYEDQDKFNVTKGDSEGIVNYGLSVKSIQVSAFMQEENQGLVKVSFRSKGDLDMNLFAREYFNGGGHKNAAGGICNLTLKEAKKLYTNSILKYINA